MSLQMEVKGQLCKEGSIECGGRYEVRIAGLYYLEYRT